MAETVRPSTIDMMPVRSRVSWGAIAAGAMVAVAVYFLLTLLGIAVGLEVSASRSDVNLGAGAALWSILTLLLAMFLGGWATSRLAVGETKLEAVLYGVILWGVLFIGMFWLFGIGVRIGFGAMMGMASGATSMAAEDGRSGARRTPASWNNCAALQQELQRPEVRRGPQEAGRRGGRRQEGPAKVNERVETLRNDPAALPSELSNDPDVQQAGEELRRGRRRPCGTRCSGSSSRWRRSSSARSSARATSPSRSPSWASAASPPSGPDARRREPLTRGRAFGARPRPRLEVPTSLPRPTSPFAGVRPVASKQKSFSIDHPIVITFLIFAIIGFMSLAAEVLKPLALSVLLSFALAPLVAVPGASRRAQGRRGLPDGGPLPGGARRGHATRSTSS